MTSSVADKPGPKKQEREMVESRKESKRRYYHWKSSLDFLYGNPLARLLVGELCWWSSSRSSERKSLEKAKESPEVRKDPEWLEYVKHIPQAKFYRGTLLHGYLVSDKFLSRLNDFKVRTDDVFICSFPKSGTTWTEEIVDLILHDCQVEQVLERPLHERVPHLEVGPPYIHWRALKRMPSSRLIASHLPYYHLPNQMKANKAKIIYVVRNPKDVCVSYFYHHKICKLFGNYSGEWDTFVDLFMKGKLVYGSWFRHVKSFWSEALVHPNNIMVVAYEELIVDFPRIVRLIGEFLGRPLTDEQIELIMEHCSFKSMQKNPAVNRADIRLTDVFDVSKIKFVRKGVIADWQNHFNDKQNQAMDELFAQEMGSIGLRFAFKHQEADEMMAQGGRIVTQTWETNPVIDQ